MMFEIPRFKDGDPLYAEQLYTLARASGEYFRWGTVASGRYGLFRPPPSIGRRRWNQLDPTANGLAVDGLFLVSEEGRPFVLDREFVIPFDPGRDRTLWLELRVPDPIKQSYPIDGYEVQFSWSKPAGRDSTFLLELGSLTEMGDRFDLAPPAMSLDATVKLNDACLSLASAVKPFVDLLIEHSRINEVDRSLLLDRLDRLGAALKSNGVSPFVTEATLMLEAAQGFFLRLSHSRDARATKYAACDGRTGRLLERWLKQVDNAISAQWQAIPKALDDCMRFPTNRVSGLTGLVQGLASLLGPCGELTRRLELDMTEVRPTEGYPKPWAAGRVLYRYEPPIQRAVVWVHLGAQATADDVTHSFVDDPSTMDVMPTGALVPDATGVRYRLAGGHAVLLLALPKDARPVVFAEDARLPADAIAQPGHTLHRDLNTTAPGHVDTPLLQRGGRMSKGSAVAVIKEKTPGVKKTAQRNKR